MLPSPEIIADALKKLRANREILVEIYLELPLVEPLAPAPDVLKEFIVL